MRYSYPNGSSYLSIADVVETRGLAWKVKKGRKYSIYMDNNIAILSALIVFASHNIFNIHGIDIHSTFPSNIRTAQNSEGIP